MQYAITLLVVSGVIWIIHPYITAKHITKILGLIKRTLSVDKTKTTLTCPVLDVEPSTTRSKKLIEYVYDSNIFVFEASIPLREVRREMGLVFPEISTINCYKVNDRYIFSETDIPYALKIDE